MVIVVRVPADTDEAASTVRFCELDMEVIVTGEDATARLKYAPLCPLHSVEARAM